MTLMQKNIASRTNISFFQESLERNKKQTNIVVPLKIDNKTIKQIFNLTDNKSNSKPIFTANICSSSGFLHLLNNQQNVANSRSRGWLAEQ